LAKDVVKAVKKGLQHKNAKLLETMVKNCGDYVHLQIAERIYCLRWSRLLGKKQTDMNVRDKILVLIGSWHQAFGGAGGRYSQYYMAYEDLRRSCVKFPKNLPRDAVPIFTPPVTTHPITTNNPKPNVLDLLADMLQAVDPSDRSAVKDEVIVDLVEQCRANQKKLVQLLATTGVLNSMIAYKFVLAKHDAIASGSPLPPQAQVRNNISIKESEKQDLSTPKPAEATVVQNAPPSENNKRSAPVLPEKQKNVAPEEDDEEEDDFALLARRHSKVRADVALTESNALVPVDVPTSSVRTKEQDMIDLLSITLSTPTLTEQTPQQPPSPSMQQTQGNIPSNYPPQPLLPQHQPQYQQFESQPQIEPQQNQLQYPQYATQQQQAFNNASHQQPQFHQYTSMYPPPPWAATPGYYTNNQSPVYTYPTSRPTFESSNNGVPHVTSGLSSPTANNVGQRPFIPSYRLFEDLNVLGNADGRFKAIKIWLGEGSDDLVGYWVELYYKQTFDLVYISF
ncbi:hypothetical protein MIMGU_mgv1a018553mg, partial [Erythranthe guttata]